MSDEAQQSPGTPGKSTPYVHRPPQRVEVVYPSFADFVVSMGPLLSKLRLFVETDEEVPLGTTVHTEIRLRDRAVLIRAMGEVSGHEEVDGDGPAGIHVELRYLDPASAALIDAVLRHGRDAIIAEPTAATGVGATAEEIDPVRDDATEVPESGELNLADWEDEVGNLVELALVDESAPASSAEVRPPSEEATFEDASTEEEGFEDRTASLLSIPGEEELFDPETSEDLESEAADALAVIAAQVMTGSGEPSEEGAIELDDTRPVPETSDLLEDTQPVAEVADDDSTAGIIGADLLTGSSPAAPATEGEPGGPPAGSEATEVEFPVAMPETEPAAQAPEVATGSADPSRDEDMTWVLDGASRRASAPADDAERSDDVEMLGRNVSDVARDESVAVPPVAASEHAATNADSSDVPDTERPSETVSQGGLAFETSDIVLADVFAADDEPSSLVKPPVDDDAFSLDEIPDSERDLWAPDGGLDELGFEEPSPSIEMYVSSFGPTVGGDAPKPLDAMTADTMTADAMTADALEDTAREPAFRWKGSTRSTTSVPDQSDASMGTLGASVSDAHEVVEKAEADAPGREAAAPDLDARLPEVVNVKPLTSVGDEETSFAFGDDTAALLGGLDAWPSDGSSAVTPPDEWPPEAPTPSVPTAREEEPLARAPDANGSPDVMDWDTPAELPDSADPPVTEPAAADDPLDQPPSEDTVAVRLGHAKSFLDDEDAPAVANAPAVAMVEPAAGPVVTEDEMPATVAAELARKRLSEIAGRGAAAQARQRSWRPLLLLLLLVALAILAWTLDWPATRWVRERLTPASTVASAPAIPDSAVLPGAPSAPPATPPGAESPAVDLPPADSSSGSATTDPSSTTVPVAGAAQAADEPPGAGATDPRAPTGAAAGAPPAIDGEAPVSAAGPEVAGEADGGDALGAARATVRAWQQAWSNQDPDAYLATYAQSFEPGNGATRAAWAASRRDRVRAPGRIRIGVDDLRVRVVAPDRVEAWFFQTYETDETIRVTWKQLDLIPEAPGRWRIQREMVRSGPPS